MKIIKTCKLKSTYVFSTFLFGLQCLFKIRTPEILTSSEDPNKAENTDGLFLCFPIA